MTPLAVGLVGAGTWAERVHAPMLAAGPETRLAGVWARRPEAARALAARHGTEPAESYEALIERSEAIAFAVPPDVQAAMAPAAAAAGRALLLEKPLALDLAAAGRLADAVARAGVVTQLVLSYRYRPSTIAWIERARAFGATGARAAFITGGQLAGPYATPWRREHGALLDLGPHALDLLEAALGPAESIAATGESARWIALTCRHAGGAVSQLALSGAVPIERPVFTIELHGPGGVLDFDARAAGDEGGWDAVRREFAAAVRASRPHALDVRHGLRLQALIERARTDTAPAA